MDDYDENFIIELEKRLMKVKEDKTREYHVLLIFDDCGDVPELKNNKAFRSIFTRWRHLNCAVIFACQYINQVPPSARVNSSYIIAGQMNRMSLDILADEFCPHNMEKKEFKHLYIRNTTNYGFLVIKQNAVKNIDNREEFLGVIRLKL
jgi:hypothetical protein